MLFRMRIKSSLSSWLQPLTLPGRVGQGEAAPLEVDAAVHQQLSEEQGGVSGRPTRRILGRVLWGSSSGTPHGPGHELNDRKPGQPLLPRRLIELRLFFLGALRAQVAHDGPTGGQVVTPSLLALPLANVFVWLA